MRSVCYFLAGRDLLKKFMQIWPHFLYCWLDILHIYEYELPLQYSNLLKYIKQSTVTYYIVLESRLLIHIKISQTVEAEKISPISNATRGILMPVCLATE